MSNKESIKKQLLLSRASDYTYSIIFFITFSFFAFAVIRPNILTIFNLQKELHDLTLIDDSYSNVIDKIINIQTSVEATRETIDVLDEALPIKPNINQLVDDVKKVSQEFGINIGKMTISEIDIKNKAELIGYKKVKIDLVTKANFEEIYEFVQGLVDQRRLKGINNISFIRDVKEGTSSGMINVKLSIEGYYL